jgi:hypothetical protein
MLLKRASLKPGQIDLYHSPVSPLGGHRSVVTALVPPFLLNGNGYLG